MIQLSLLHIYDQRLSQNMNYLKYNYLTHYLMT
jgi:hypothetical protein